MFEKKSLLGRVPVVLCLHQHLELSVFILAILIDVLCNLTLVLIYISLMEWWWICFHVLICHLCIFSDAVSFKPFVHLNFLVFIFFCLFFLFYYFYFSNFFWFIFKLGSFLTVELRVYVLWIQICWQWCALQYLLVCSMSLHSLNWFS